MFLRVTFFRAYTTHPQETLIFLNAVRDGQLIEEFESLRITGITKDRVDFRLDMEGIPQEVYEELCRMVSSIARIEEFHYMASTLLITVKDTPIWQEISATPNWQKLGMAKSVIRDDGFAEYYSTGNNQKDIINFLGEHNIDYRVHRLSQAA